MINTVPGLIGTQSGNFGQDTGFHEASLEPRLNRVVKNAAEGAGCPVAVFYMYRNNCFEPRAAFGLRDYPPSLQDNQALTASHAQAGDALFVINDCLSEPNFAKSDAYLRGWQVDPFRFLATIPVQDGPGNAVGVLVVADAVPHAGLTDATTYVLRAHAAQLSLLFEMHGLPDTGASAPVRSTSAERLRLLESVVVNANDAVVITEAEPLDLPGPRIVYCNAAFTRTTGYSEADVLGLSPRILQSPETDRKALAKLRAALSRWEPVEVELLNRKKDGTEFYVELSIVPVADEKGWFTHWVSVQRDVSDRRVAEETRLRAQLAELDNLALATEIRERKRVEAQLLYAAFHDDLTKLRNRAFFMDRLSAAISRTKKGRDFSYAVLFMDLDRFKLVNDSLGHRFGDLLLMEVARRMRESVRPQDTLARIGGDEFALLVEDSGGCGDLGGIAARLIKAVGRSLWLGKQEVFPSCSIGLVSATKQYELPEEVLRDADIAMYRSKRRMAGEYTIFSNQMHDLAVEALELETDLRNAVARKEFVLDYQPIMDTATRLIIGFEALIRWRHPRRGLLPPAAFIATAEETGLIYEIGRWVLREACLQLREWQDRFQGMDLRLSVNTSGEELKRIDFPAELQATLTETGMEATCLQLEITESIFIEQPVLIGQILSDIRALGIRIALDDFGTGYSSLSYMDRYPMDVVKIDRSFVGAMLNRKRTLAIVKTVLSLAEALELEVTAEGVEEEAQLHCLRGLGCQSVQGYFLGHPMGRDVAATVLSDQHLRMCASQGIIVRNGD